MNEDLLELWYMDFLETAYTGLREAYGDSTGLTFAEIAERLNWDRYKVEKIICGVSVPSMKDYSDIARAMGYRISLNVENLQEMGIKDE